MTSLGAFRRVAALTIVAVLATSAAALTAVGAGAQGDGTVTKSTITVQLTSNQTVLEEVGRAGDTTYGWNLLTGEAGTDSGDVSVTLLGNVEYVEGSGPFYGFVTLRYASLSTLGLRMRGTATKQPTGAPTSRRSSR